MSKLTNKQIVERSRKELAKASPGPITSCTDHSASLPYCCSSVCGDCTTLVGGDGQPLWVRGLDECKDDMTFLRHAHENLAACHAEIDRLKAEIVLLQREPAYHNVGAFCLPNDESAGCAKSKHNGPAGALKPSMKGTDND